MVLGAKHKMEILHHSYMESRMVNNSFQEMRSELKRNTVEHVHCSHSTVAVTVTVTGPFLVVHYFVTESSMDLLVSKYWQPKSEVPLKSSSAFLVASLPYAQSLLAYPLSITCQN